VLSVLHVNPGTYRAINTPRSSWPISIYSLTRLLGAPLAADVIRQQTLAHTASIIVFVALYGCYVCTLFVPGIISRP